jgi:hypothetical protein
MPQTAAALIPILIFVSSIAGALASGIIAWIESRFPRRHHKQVATLPLWQRAAYTLLYTPLYARGLSFVLSAVISIGCAYLLALLQGQPGLPAVDTALAGTLAIVANQITHGAVKLDKQPTYSRGLRSYDLKDGK